MLAAEAKTPTVVVNSPDDSERPVSELKPDQLNRLGRELRKSFEQYDKDRKETEDKWLRNLRQYLGIYDPEIESELVNGRSKAYPRVTRVKCISMVSRIMDLMFPGNEKNWRLSASPSAEMRPEDVQAALTAYVQENTTPDGQPPQLSNEIVQMAVQDLADQRAKMLSDLIDDQLHELGGPRAQSYVSLNRAVIGSGVLYGLGVLRGPFVREDKSVRWGIRNGQVVAEKVKRYLPQFEFLPVWDFYPDMSSKSFQTDLDGYFTRLVMSKSQLRKLSQRSDFFKDVVKRYIADYPQGDYKPKSFETELKNMSTRSNVSDFDKDASSRKYELIVWYGPVSASVLENAGVEVPEMHKGDEIDAEVWLLGDKVIKAEVSPWYKIGVDIRTAHTFVFDEDDSSPAGNGLPNVVRDSQMSICAATRMLLDNAGVTCGPQVEVNTQMLLPGQNASTIEAFKIWYTESGMSNQPRAIQNISIDSHIDELMKMVDMFMRFADMETFIGPATGGDVRQQPSEPMRTAAGASMLRGDAALPFKDIIRNFDNFTQSLIGALVDFNRKFNPSKAPEGDYNVIPRGATSLIAKEIRGMQIDQLAATLTDEERMHVDERKMATARFSVRDLEDMLVPESVAKQRIAAREAAAAQAQEMQSQLMSAELRKTLAEAMKDISQANKNQAAGQATTIEAASKVIDRGVDHELNAAIADQAAGDNAQGVQGQRPV